MSSSWPLVSVFGAAVGFLVRLGQSQQRSQRPLLFEERPLVPIRARRGVECGHAALAMTMNLYLREVTLDDLVAEMPPTDGGINALQMVQAAQARGLGARGLEIGDLRKDGRVLRRGDIMHVDGHTFVVVDHVTRDAVIVLDSLAGERRIGFDASPDEFAGVTLVFANSDALLRERFGDPAAELPRARVRRRR